MIKNYFKIAWRNITKRSFYSLLNIIGLSTGIVFTFLIWAYVWNELQVNKKLNNASHQYILTSQWKDPNMGYELATLGPLAKRLKEEYPNLVKNYYRFDGITSFVSKEEKHFRENVQLGDSTLLTLYGFKLLDGNAATALNDPYSVVVTKDIAMKYFGKTNIVGETITMGSSSGAKHDFTIKAVLDDVPENSVTTLNAENKNAFFVPTAAYNYFNRADLEAWQNIQIASYVELQDGVTAQNLSLPIQQLLQQNTTEVTQKNLVVKPILLTDYYLQKDNALVKRMLYALSFIGLFILLMAVVNFINISISSGSNRMKEIGVRKVMGGMRSQLIFQFLTESLTLVLIATVLAVAIYPVVEPLFAQMVGKPLPALLSLPLYFIFVVLIFIVLLGLLAGIYPAFILSSVNTINSLKGKLKTVKENILLRKSLVGFQFCIALVVLIGATIVTQQIAHFFGQGLGYNKEYIVASQVPRDWTPVGVRKMETVRNEFAAMPQVANVTLSYEIPNGMNGGQPPIYKFGTDSTQAIAMQALVTDENYLNTYQIPLQAGEFFDSKGLDSGKVILNEKAVTALGYKDAATAIGQAVRIPGDPNLYTIKGVTTNFHFGSMQQTMQPMIVFNVNNAINYRYLSFKLKPGNISNTIETIQKKWATLLPGTSFDYVFMDDALKKLYKSEIQLQKAAYTATILSIIIVLMGVLGLVSLSVQKRTKEIGIRKVLGSSVSGIIILFMKDFLTVIIVAGIIACPIAWFIMHGWLSDYAYRIQLTATPFLICIIGLGLITTILIALQTLKTGMENPVKSLRTE